MDIGQILLVLAAVTVGFFAKGVTGIGGPIIAIPVLAAFMGVEYAVAVITIPALAANAWMMWVHRESASSVRQYLIPLLVAGAVGVVFGAWILVTANEDVLALALALFVIVYIIWYSTHTEFKLSEKHATRLTIPVGLVGGGLQGATGISAPVIATFVHSLRLPRAGFIFAITVPFTVLGMVQVISMAALGVYTTDRLFAALLAIIPVAFVLPIAMRLSSKLSQRTFENVVLVLLGVTAARLIWSVF